MLAAVLAAVAVPFLVSLGAAGLLRARAAAATGCAIGVGFLAANVAIVGTIPFFVPGPDDALTVSAAAISLLAAILAYWRPSQRTLALVFAAAAVAAVAGCVGSADLYLAATLANPRTAVVLIGCAVAIAKLWRLARTDAADPGIVIAAALGLAGVVAVGPGRADAGVAASLGMAGLGWLLVAEPGGKGRGSPSAWLVSATLLIALAADLGRDALSPPWAMLLLLPCLWAGDAGKLLASRRKARRNRPQPRLAMLLAAVPALVAIAVAAILAADARHRLL